MTNQPDFQASLDEMDRRLREIERELAAVGQDVPGGDPLPPPIPIRSLPPEPDDAADPARVRAEAEAEAQRILAEARAEAARIVAEARALAATAPPETPDTGVVCVGEVAVTAGPFADMAEVHEFEVSLLDLRRVADARLRGVEGDCAVFDVALTGPIRLTEEMTQGLAPRFHVEVAERERITIRFT